MSGASPSKEQPIVIDLTGENSEDEGPVPVLEQQPLTKRKPMPLTLAPDGPTASGLLQSSRRLPFKTADERNAFIKASAYQVLPFADRHTTQELYQRFKDTVRPFHDPEKAHEGPALGTKAGWAMLGDQNIDPWMRDAVQITKQKLLPEIDRLASDVFGISDGHWMLALDRWKCQQVGPETKNPRDPARIVHACWKRANSLHEDLREEEFENNLACLAVIGEGARHMVVFDYALMDKEIESTNQEIEIAPKQVEHLLKKKARVLAKHTCLLEMLNRVEKEEKGFYDKFNDEERLLIKPYLSAVRIEPGQMLLFSQARPHCLTESTTAETETASVTAYIGIKIVSSKYPGVLEDLQAKLCAIYGNGKQLVYQQKVGKNGFTDNAVNKAHEKSLHPFLFKQYDIPPIDKGKGGITSKRSLPSVSDFLKDVKRARKDPSAFEPGMQCEYLKNIDSILPTEEELKNVMEIMPFGKAEERSAGALY